MIKPDYKKVEGAPLKQPALYSWWMSPEAQESREKFSQTVQENLPRMRTRASNVPNHQPVY